jgi:hypothetical protein
MAQPFSVFRDSALARFDLPERALLIRLRFCKNLLGDAYQTLKNCRCRRSFTKRLCELLVGPIPEVFPDLGKRMHGLIQYLQKAPGELSPPGTPIS